MQNEKAEALESDGLNTDLKRELTMKNLTTIRNKFQSDLFKPERPKKVIEVIHCGDCHHTRPLDGYRFKLVPICFDCRTERSLEILSNQIERRAKR